VSNRDPHPSFIKTPKQLIVVILLSFVVPIIAIILLVQLVVSHPAADPNAMTDEAIAKRLQPVGGVEFGAAAAAGSRSGEQVYKAVCTNCHQTGVAGAPKIGDKAAWAPRIKEGLNEMVTDAIKGVRAMPPRGGDPSLTDEEVARAVVYMANQSGARFKQPAAASQKPDGKKVYETTCSACHATGVAGAPKLGDKAAWAPHLMHGADGLLQSALKGKGAMPPKGGNPSLSDDDVRAAVEFMLSQSK
jgi:cytochrome c5